jgi:hypothetical protein
VSRHKKKELPKELFTPAEAQPELDDRGIPNLEPELLKPLQEYCNRVRKVFEDMPANEVFTPNGPQSLAVKTRFGSFRTEHFKGHEEMKPMHAYVGRSGKIIYCFRPWKAADYTMIEIRANQIDRISGFKARLDELIDESDQAIVEKTIRDKAAMEAAKRKEAEDRLAANPTFGSW